MGTPAEDIAALRAENEYLRDAMRQAMTTLAYRRMWNRIDFERANHEARKTLEFGLAHAGDGK